MPSVSTLKQALDYARERKIALGHFNVSTLDGIWAVFNAAKNLDVPVVIGVSEGERDFIGIKTLAVIIRQLREEYAYPLFLNADHTYSLERIKEVVEAGYDSVIFDGAKLSYEDNRRQTQEVVNYVKSVRPDMLTEAEVGYIGTSSKLLDEVPEAALTDPSTMPTPEQVVDFVQTTGVDCISPAVGNIHGMLKNAPNPKLNIDLIQRIHQATPAHLVLHGGSGIADDDFRAAIAAGISMIHINTEIRLAWKQAIQQSLGEDENEVAPYKLLAPSLKAMEQVVTNRLKLFSGLTV